MDIEVIPIFGACLAAFLAGFVDAIVGGGGLVQLPALLVLYPTAPVVTLLGTNKLSSIAGTVTAVVTYTRRIALPWKILIPASGVAFVASLGGATAATIFPPGFLKPIILMLLVGVFLYTVLRPGLGTGSAETLHPDASRRTKVAAGVIGAYDGFLCPGTGNFLIFALVRWVGMPFLLATAAAKVINTATNLAAIVLFSSTGHILYAIALPMAGANLIGGYLGAHLAIAKGNRFIRLVFIVVVTVLMARIGYDVLAHQ
jgi:uncharacterized membrane protein YfcA